MTMTHRKSNLKFIAQRGYAMLGIIALVGIATTAVVVTTLSATAVRNQQARNDSNALALAKQALIAYAASNNTQPGSLPCPDAVTNIPGVNVPNDGVADLLVGPACPSTVGRLPWQTLGLPDLRDGASERLWYAVSPNFQNSSTNRINASLNGQFYARKGESYTSGVVAIVFAPGQAIDAQHRDASHVNSADNYLESYASNLVTIRAQNDPLVQNHTYNDQVSVITPADIFSLVERRVAKEVQTALQNYYTTTNALPWPAQTYSLNDGVYSFPAMSAPSPLPTPATTFSGYIPTDNATLVLPSWFAANNWGAAMNYRVDSDCAGGLVGTCGAAFANYTAGSSGVLIGFSANTANTGTKALLSFNGVNTMYTNYQTTVLKAAVQ